MSSRRNDGVLVTGGTLAAGQVVAGRNAKAVASFYGPVGKIEEAGREDVAAALRDLMEGLKRNSDQIKDFDEILESTNLVAAELAKPRPNKTIVTTVLSGIGQGVSSVAGLVTAVKSLADAAAAIF